ncbi:hypothetical protein NLJ89_g2964 [Agrocybe chaxingu]|uniref:Transmembrane protein n=1 Tax=Agrocybe chaxingu TaxID=84603 RepID=A0A9W8K5U0_9AGAR|nr:hypothetical protein NLJ89_g2964 [Agrocybe chaxingu]
MIINLGNYRPYQSDHVIVGVSDIRVAVYIQAVLNLVPPFIAGWDGSIDDQELEDLIERYSSSQVLGIALVISAFVQANTFGLSAYYGNIILLLSWINVTSTLVFIPVLFGAEMARNATGSDTLNPFKLFRKVSLRVSRKDCLAFLNIGDEMIFMSMFGLWLWVTFPNFGTEQECIPYTHLVIFKSIPTTSRILRPCLIAFYSLNVVMLGPILWITVAAIIPALLLAFLSKVGLVRRLGYNTGTGNGRSRPAHHNLFSKHPRAYFFSVVGATFAIQALLIFFTELTIKTNRPLLKTGPQEPKENEWTLGQTLALMQTAYAKYEDVLKVWRMFRSDGKQSRASAAAGNSTAAEGPQTATGQNAQSPPDAGTHV